MILVGCKYTFILTELIGGGDLFSYYCKAKLIGEERVADAERQVAWCTFQLLLALQYLHKRGVAHRDIKMENILVFEINPYSRILLTDFGMACRSVEYDDNGKAAEKDGVDHAEIGTIPYQAPEIVEAFHLRRSTNQPILSSSQFGSEVDLWSLGCLVHEMLLGQYPFGLSPNDHESEIFRKTMAGELGFDSLPLTYLSNLARSFIEGLLRREPKHRMPIKQGLKHEWIVQFCDSFNTLYRNKVLPKWSRTLPIVKTFDSIPEIASTSNLYSLMTENMARRSPQVESPGDHIHACAASERVHKTATAPPSDIAKRMASPSERPKRRRMIDPIY